MDEKEDDKRKGMQQEQRERRRQSWCWKFLKLTLRGRWPLGLSVSHLIFLAMASMASIFGQFSI